MRGDGLEFGRRGNRSVGRLDAYGTAKRTRAARQGVGEIIRMGMGETSSIRGGAKSSIMKCEGNSAEKIAMILCTAPNTIAASEHVGRRRGMSR